MHWKEGLRRIWVVSWEYTLRPMFTWRGLIRRDGGKKQVPQKLTLWAKEGFKEGSTKENPPIIEDNQRGG